jgi:ribonuclease HI
MFQQKSIFDLISEKEEDVWYLFVDGAARGNPGPAGAGIIVSKNKKIIEKCGFFLGEKTNNQAEYLALLIGIFILTKQFHITHSIYIFSDSELLVNQIKGTYRVKNESLGDLHKKAQLLLKNVCFTIMHIPRSENSFADKMANDGIDKKNALPDSFKKWFFQEKNGQSKQSIYKLN